MVMGTINNRKYTIPDPKHPGEFISIILGREIRGTISKEDPENPGTFIGDKIFRIRPGNGFYTALLGVRYQDQYDYFLPTGYATANVGGARQQWIAAVHKWRFDLTTAQKEAYSKVANKGLRMSGYNLFMREAMKGLVEMYVDRGDPAAYDKVKTDLITDATWRDIDLSAIVPAGAKAVLLKTQIESAGVGDKIRYRLKGNSNEINACGCEALRANVERTRLGITAIDANRVMQYNADNVAWTTLSIVVRGWWT